MLLSFPTISIDRGKKDQLIRRDYADILSHFRHQRPFMPLPQHITLGIIPDAA